MKTVFVVKDWLTNMNLSKHNDKNLAELEVQKLEQEDKKSNCFVAGTYVILELEDSEDLLKEKEGEIW